MKPSAANSRYAMGAIFAVFFMESAVLGSWVPRIPDVKANLGISDFTLGLSLFAMPLGTLGAFVVAGGILDRIGLRRGCQLFIPTWALVFVLPGMVASAAGLFFALLLGGAAVGLCEVAMNTKADHIERGLKRRIMSRCHGFWSLGSVVGALSGSSFAQLGIGVDTHFLMVMPVLAALGFVASTLLPTDAALADSMGVPAAAVAGPDAKQRPPIFRLPSSAILLLCLMPVGIMAVEGAFIEWSAVFMRSVLDASPLVIGVTYAFFSVVMAITRLSGDWVIEAVGALNVVRWSAMAATLGMTCFALAPNAPVAFVGAALSGLGVAIVYPLAMTAAARRRGSPADNVAALSLISFSAFLVLPPLIGFLSDAIGLRWALLWLAPLAATTLLLADEVVKES